MKAIISEHRVHLYDSENELAAIIEGRVSGIKADGYLNCLMVGIQDNEGYVPSIWVDTIQKGD